MKATDSEAVSSDIIEAIPAMRSKRKSTREVYLNQLKGILRPWALDIIEEMAGQVEDIGESIPPGPERAKIFNAAREMRDKGDEF